MDAAPIERRRANRARARFPILLIGLCLALAAAAAPESRVVAATGLSREYDLKSAFLFNFAHFVEWPPQTFVTPDAPFTIGILGPDPFGTSLQEIVAGESVDGHPMVIRHCDGPAEAGGCQILFVSASALERTPRILEHGGNAVLTVGDAKDFAAHYGIVGFVTAGNRLRLQINLATAEAAKLRISSKLLRQAEIVGAGRRP